MKNRRNFLLLCLVLTLSLLALGCGEKKKPIQGAVTYDGKPLALGTITLIPKAEGARAIQTIKDGKFNIIGKYGITPGEYEITIEGFTEAPADDPDQQVSKLFPDYTFQKKINAGEVLTIEVPVKKKQK